MRATSIARSRWRSRSRAGKPRWPAGWSGSTTAKTGRSTGTTTAATRATSSGPGASRPAISLNGPSCCCSWSVRSLPRAAKQLGPCCAPGTSSTPRCSAAGMRRMAASPMDSAPTARCATATSTSGCRPRALPPRPCWPCALAMPVTGAGTTASGPTAGRISSTTATARGTASSRPTTARSATKKAPPARPTITPWGVLRRAADTRRLKKNARPQCAPAAASPPAPPRCGLASHTSGISSRNRIADA